MDLTHAISAFQAYGWAVLGIALSVLIPVLAAAVKAAFPTPPAAGLAAGQSSSGPARVWKFAVPYLVVAAFSLAVGLLVVAFVEFADWRAALIGGYAWDATLQKIRTGFQK